jgi:hypothetical protein
VDPATSGLRFAIFAGGLPYSNAENGSPIQLPSLHFASSADTIVSLAESKRLAAAFAAAELVRHDGGHSVPQRADDVKQIISFLQARRDEIYPDASLMTLSADMEEAEDPRVGPDLRDELVALGAMLAPEELVRVAPLWPVQLGVRIAGVEGASLRFIFPPGYPNTAPCLCEFAAECFSLLAHQEEVMEAVESARAPLGFPSVLAMTQAAQQWFEDHSAEMAGRGTGANTADSDDAADPADADAWWLNDDAEVDTAMLERAERRAIELIPDGSLTAASGSWARECGAGRYGRPWEFVVGLVGKPSAGKSTFFNAATQPDADHEASMAPHPFTTIDPNIAPGWFAAPCPSAYIGCLDRTVPEHGWAANGRRYPLLVKDVAGLVPGAYLGRGRGNAFLHDLLDADSLIHVVDASGRSDREGVDQGAASPTNTTDVLDEVGWVRHEIHLWIFSNVRAKWDSVRKRARMGHLQANKQVGCDAVADRLFGLFVGYHTSRQMVVRVYEAMGCSLQGIADTVLKWQEYDLHLLVACFLRARFPTVVALNKADVPEAAERVERARAALGDQACLPVSARSEWWLVEQARKGHLSYQEGGGVSSVVISPDAPPAVAQQWAQLRTRVLEPFGSTGVLAALTLAVLRKRPILICPVVDFNTLCGLSPPTTATSAAQSAGARGRDKGGYIQAGRGGDGSQDEMPVLASMVMLRAGSTVEEAFAALSRMEMLRGDFVRAEQLLEDEAGAGAAANSVRVLKRDDPLRNDGALGAVVATSSRAIVLRILTNKKAK